MGMPAYLKARSGRPGRSPLDDDERVRRAFDYSTRHDAVDFPDLKHRMDQQRGD